MKVKFLLACLSADKHLRPADASMIGHMREWVNECLLESRQHVGLLMIEWMSQCLIECRQHVGPARKDSGSGVLGHCGGRAEEEQGRSAGAAASQRVLLP